MLAQHGYHHCIPVQFALQSWHWLAQNTNVRHTIDIRLSYQFDRPSCLHWNLYFFFCSVIIKESMSLSMSMQSRYSANVTYANIGCHFVWLAKTNFGNVNLLTFSFYVFFFFASAFAILGTKFLRRLINSLL